MEKNSRRTKNVNTLDARRHALIIIICTYTANLIHKCALSRRTLYTYLPIRTYVLIQSAIIRYVLKRYNAFNILW